jgi:gluconokinase
MSFKSPMLLVVMGVSGCGKSTFSQAIGDALGLRVADGDDFHAPQSVAKMQAGIALDDADRWPWLDRIAAYLNAGWGAEAHGAGRVIACSALKRAYRDRIRKTLPQVRFVFLDGDAELIRSRMRERTGHFMPPGLLDDQLRTLQRPAPDETDVINVSLAQPIAQMVAQVVAQVARALPSHHVTTI